MRAPSPALFAAEAAALTQRAPAALHVTADWLIETERQVRNIKYQLDLISAHFDNKSFRS